MAESFARSIRSIRADRARPMLLWIALAAALLGAWGAWFGFGSVAEYEVSVQARIEAVEQAHRIDAPLGGRIEVAQAMLGRSVQPGDVLAEVDRSGLKLDRAEAIARLEALEHQFAALEDEIAAQRHALDEQRRTTPIKLEEARARHREALAMMRYAAVNAEQLALLAARGDASEVERRRAEAEHEQTREHVEAQRLTIDRLKAEDELAEADRLVRIGELIRERERLKGQIAAEQAAIARIEFELDQRRIVAPVAGVIAEAAPLQPGRVIAEGEWIATIIPRPETHRVLADFDALTALGRIEPGQRARVRLTGFPSSQYGTIGAKVEHVAGEARDGRVRALLRIDPDQVPAAMRLQHDLPGTVEVEVDRVSPAILVLRAAGRRVGQAPADAPGNGSGNAKAASVTRGARF